MEFCISEKANNSIATELQVNLLNTRKQKLKYFLCTTKFNVIFKQKNEINIG